METNLFEHQVWESAWNHDETTSLRIMQRLGQGNNQTEEFKKWAISYNKNSFSREGRERSNRILTWIENQGVAFNNLSVLDIGAASGVFSIPFSERGAKVTAIESSPDLSILLEKNAKKYSVHVDVIRKPFEETTFDNQTHIYDLVFASMCPAMKDWETVEKALKLAKKYCYISMMAGQKENHLMDELLPVIDIKPRGIGSSDMAYLLQLLYINGYSYQTFIERQMKTVKINVNRAIDKLPEWFIGYQIPLEEKLLKKCEDYLRETYEDEIMLTMGGRFGKVLVHMEN
ncbi:class I SAM-dependent methyltransferase [Metabacillus malikii]|uniref:RNA methylase n=1 Tax=Metabacillus malikii TaxID=1504265 RepID=A0ABT9ZBR1_9BACI|nr:methyltransferase domain-containing protein [Metabacillus malikii]MDQ0229707.1 putative RNA methylase [Metabacillus malikii]